MENMLAETNYNGGILQMDVSALPRFKQNIRQLKKEKAETLTSSGDRKKIKRIQRQIKLLKRQTRDLAQEKKKLAAAAAAEAAGKAAAEKAAADSAAAAAKAAEAPAG
jgi:membrane protein involved in colicin uptake